MTYTIWNARGEHTGTLRQILEWLSLHQDNSPYLEPRLPTAGEITMSSSYFEDNDDCLLAAEDLLLTLTPIGTDIKSRWTTPLREEITIKWR